MGCLERAPWSRVWAELARAGPSWPVSIFGSNSIIKIFCLAFSLIWVIFLDALCHIFRYSVSWNHATKCFLTHADSHVFPWSNPPKFVSPMLSFITYFLFSTNECYFGHQMGWYWFALLRKVQNLPFQLGLFVVLQLLISTISSPTALHQSSISFMSCFKYS